MSRGRNWGMMNKNIKLQKSHKMYVTLSNTSLYSLSLRIKDFLRFPDQICPKKSILGTNLQKQLSNLESTPLNTPLNRVSFQTKHFKVLGPN